MREMDYAADGELDALAMALEAGAAEIGEEGSRRRVWDRVAGEIERAEPAGPLRRLWLVPALALAGVGAAVAILVLVTISGGGHAPANVAEALVVQTEGGPPLVTYVGGPTQAPEALPVSPDSFGNLFLQWTADGETLAYVSGSDIWVMSADGQTRNLTSTPDRVEGLPRWSPDGRRLAIASRPLQPEETPDALTAGPGSLTLVNADGSRYEVVGEGEMLWSPSWSPDGRQVAYDAGGSVFVFDTELGETTRYTPERLGLPDAAYLAGASWSPARDELLVYFSASNVEPSRDDLIAGTAPSVKQGFAVVAPEAAAATIIFEYEAPFLPATPAQWSPDGQRVLIALNPSPIFANPEGMWIVNRTGSGTRSIEGIIPYQALWSPSGEEIAYIDASERRVTVLDVATLEVIAQPGPDSGVEGIAWRPGGGE